MAQQSDREESEPAGGATAAGGPEEVVLVTGFPGFIGGRLVSRLPEDAKQCHPPARLSDNEVAPPSIGPSIQETLQRCTKSLDLAVLLFASAKRGPLPLPGPDEVNT